MSAERELYERRVHRVSPARAYAIASLLSLTVVAFGHGWLDATVAWWLLLFVFAELARMTIAFAWARQEIERDWLIRIRRIFRVIQHASGVQVCVDGRRWSREQLRGIGVEERVTEHDSYWRVHLLMDDCLILLEEGLPQSAALQECFRLARLLSISEPPYPIGLPARFGAAAVFGLFRLPLVLGLAFQSPWTAWLVWSAALLLDGSCVLIARGLRNGARAEACHLGVLPEKNPEPPMDTYASMAGP